MEEKKEMVNHPSHYNQGDIECIDAMIAAKGLEKTIAFCECSVFKYDWRLGNKDAEEQEVGKIKWYLDKYLELKKVKEAKDETKLKETIARMKREGLTQKQIDNILGK